MAAGPVWLARKIRSAAYSPVGMVLDAILIATGIGKVAQVVVWAIIVILDIYELISGDYEHPNEPMWMRILFMGIDVLGLVFAGAAAKAGRVALEAAVGGARTAEQMGANIAKSPRMIEFLRKIVSGIKELPAKLSGVASQVSKNKFWGGFVSKALNGLGTFIKKILDSIKGMFKSKALKPVLVQIGLITGIGTGVEVYSDIQQKKEKGKEKDLVKTLDTTKTNFDQIFA
jgi:hypothetical protein